MVVYNKNKINEAMHGPYTLFILDDMIEGRMKIEYHKEPSEITNQLKRVSTQVPKRIYVGVDQLIGKKIKSLYHSSENDIETIEILDDIILSKD